MNTEADNRKKKMLELLDILRAAERDYLNGKKGYTVEEVAAYMRQAIKDTASVKLGLTDEEITAFREEYAKNA